MGLLKNKTTINLEQYDSDGNIKGNGGTNNKRWRSQCDDDDDNNNVDDDYDE